MTVKYGERHGNQRREIRQRAGIALVSQGGAEERSESIGRSDRDCGIETRGREVSGKQMIQIIHETHETPANVAHRLLRAGGINHFDEANYRTVWGWNRLTWIGGKFED